MEDNKSFGMVVGAVAAAGILMAGGVFILLAALILSNTLLKIFV